MQVIDKSKPTMDNSWKSKSALPTRLTFLTVAFLFLSLISSSEGQFIEPGICKNGLCYCINSMVDCNRQDRLQGVPGILPSGFTELVIKNGEFGNPILERRNLTNLKQLISLKVLLCGLEQIHEQAFIDLTLLRYLDLSHNKLKVIADYTFYTLQLEELHLMDNIGLKLNRNSFKGLATKQLNLRSNGLKVLDYETFAEIHINKLYLFNNSIRVVDPRFQKIFNKKPKVLDLSSNPIHCTCKLAWLHRLIMADSEGYKNMQIICSSPPKFANKNIETLNPRVFTCPSPQIQAISLDIWPSWAQLVCTATGASTPGLSWTYQEGSTVKTVRQLPQNVGQESAAETGHLMRTALAFNVSVTPVRRSYNCTTWGEAGDTEQSIVVHIRGPAAVVDIPGIPTQVPRQSGNSPLDAAKSPSLTDTGDKPDVNSPDTTHDQSAITKQHFIFRKQFTLLEMVGAVVGTFTITLALLLILSRVIKVCKKQREKKKTYWSTPGSAYSATGSHEYDVPRLDLHTATYPSRSPAYNTYNPNEMNFLDFKTQEKIYNR